MLTDLPNIGTVLASKLKDAGIHSVEELCSMGSENAFIRFATLFPSDICIQILYALEGAICGIRWHNLESSRKTELKSFYKTIESGLG